MTPRAGCGRRGMRFRRQSRQQLPNQLTSRSDGRGQGQRQPARAAGEPLTAADADAPDTVLPIKQIIRAPLSHTRRLRRGRIEMMRKPSKLSERLRSKKLRGVKDSRRALALLLKQ